jgi:hypothetical protein
MIPGENITLRLKILTAGGAEGLTVRDPAAGAAEGGFGPDGIPKPGGEGMFGGAEPAVEPGFKKTHDKYFTSFQAE